MQLSRQSSDRLSADLPALLVRRGNGLLDAVTFMKGLCVRFSSVLSSLLKGKLLAIALVSVAVVGGTAVMAAATPGGRNLVHAIVGLRGATSTPEPGRELFAEPGHHQ